MSRKNNEGPVLSGPVISSLQLHSPRYHQHWAGQVRGHGPLAPVYTQGRWPYCPYTALQPPPPCCTLYIRIET